MRALRRRWPVVLGLVVAVAVGGSVLGPRLYPPGYVSAGLVDVSTLRQSGSSGGGMRLQGGDTFAQMQAELIRSHELLRLAVEDDRLVAMGWPQGDTGVRRLRQALSIHQPGRESLLSIEVRASSPELARRAVDCVLDAFVRFHVQVDARTSAAQSDALTRRAAQLAGQIAVVDQQLDVMTRPFGGYDAYERQRNSQLTELQDLNKQLLKLEGTIAESALPAPSGFDQTLARMEQSLATQAAEYEMYLERFGPRHPLPQRVERQLAAQQQVVDQLKRAYQVEHAGETAREHVRLTRTIAALRERLASTAALDRAISDLSDQRKRLDNQHTQALNEIDALTATACVDVLTPSVIVSRGYVPPHRAASSGLIGAGIGGFVVLAVLFGAAAFDPRLHWPQQLAHATAGEVLAVLPRIVAGRDDLRELAADSLGRLRERIAARATDRSQAVIGVTSVRRGDGATTVATQLAGSFAEADQRVLVIDADPVGRGASEAFGLMGAVGLINVIDGHDINQAVHPTATPGVFAMPYGVAAGGAGDRLSASGLQQVVQQLGVQYQWIVIDGGVAMARAASAAVVAVSSQTLLVVGRGRGASAARCAAQSITRHAGQPSTMVFNGADAEDVHFAGAVEPGQPIWPVVAPPMVVPGAAGAANAGQRSAA